MRAHSYIITLQRLANGQWQAMLLDTASGHVVDDTLIGWNPWGTIMFAVERAHQFAATRDAKRMPIVHGSRRAYVDVSAWGTKRWDAIAAKRVAVRLGAA